MKREDIRVTYAVDNETLQHSYTATHKASYVIRSTDADSAQVDEAVDNLIERHYADIKPRIDQVLDIAFSNPGLHYNDLKRLKAELQLIMKGQPVPEHQE